MPRLMYRCPQTGEPTPTQLVLDAVTLKTIQLPDFVLECRACGRRHVWSRDEVWLEEAEPS